MSKKLISGLVIGIVSVISIYSIMYSSNEQVIAQENSPASIHIDKAQVAQWIKQQGKEKEYFLDKLTYKFVDLDEDNDLELVASATGGTHLGSFFIFDKQKEGFKLIAEKYWHVSDENFNKLASNELIPYETKNNKRLFETIEDTGGSGVHVENIHLWYLDNGKFVEAWEANLKTLTSFENIYSATIATYHLNDDRLFYFSNSYTHPEEDTKTTPQFTQKTSIFRFDGIKFIAETP
ncbi:ABC transporter permease [uncultured Brevibacillus sp.]|uniref:ABC transporter permease n=1 Tax=uncultured Brevibacillus sp. TaxID=169970 RepID=UPI002595CB12|nr:ABC transporter permease [uncultured Brevibacillus sp.]